MESCFAKKPLLLSHFIVAVISRLSIRIKQNILKKRYIKFIRI